MSKARQTTLKGIWGNQTGAGSSSSSNNPMLPPPPPGNPGTSRGKGRGRGTRGGTNTNATTGRGKGRGRGRGRGGSSNVNTSVPEVIELEDEDDDAFLDQAMTNYELTSNTISKAFKELNSATDLPGFERSAGDIWIYPTNRQVRDYQFNIVKTALYHNTLVSLPTGLGKTFIAAVVMYNFHRWYPNNLIIFMAPTKPLVAQQLDACHNLMGIKPSKMIELTGQIAPKRREEIWKERKVFFLTPQVLTSDLNRGFCPAERIRCIVVDEAHKAQGNYAYSQVISMVVEKTKCFRVLGLSATPGNDLSAVQEVLKNLLIAKIELRSETSNDILPYTHQKQVETVVVPIGQEIKEVQDKVVQIYQIYTGKLMKDKFLSGSGFSLSQYQLIKARDAARQKLPPNFPTYQKKAMEIDFNTCITLAHALDLLQIHGLRSFFSFMNGVIGKSKGNPVVAAELKRSTNIEEILSDVQTKLNISLDNSVFDLSTSGLFTTTSPKPRANGSIASNPANPDDYLLSHPKMVALRNLVEEHFKNNSTDTRIMIFSQYRDSVQEIGNMLNGLGPQVRPMVFFGQAKAGAGGTSLKQKDQAVVVREFRSGGFNVLVSTSVGEEGLDIGEVDLIICFDSSRSPTRLVQRMGRTGRQRQGKTIFLLTQGKEERMYYTSVQQQSSISKNITDASVLEPYLYQDSPRMVPLGVTPECYKMDIILSSEQNHLPPTQLDVGETSTPPTRSNIFGNAGRKVKKPKELGKSAKVKLKVTKKESKKQETQDEEQNTITRCLVGMKDRTKLQNPTAAIPEVVLPDIFEDNELPMHEDSAFIMNDTYDSSESTVGYGQQYRSHLSNMLGVQEVTSNTTSRCVFLTQVPDEQDITVSTELQNIDPNELNSILDRINVGVIREKLNAAYTLGPTTMCSCGMYNEDVNQSDFDIDYYQQEEETENESFQHEHSNNLSITKQEISYQNVPQPNQDMFDDEFQLEEENNNKQELSLADVDIDLLFEDEFEDTNAGAWIGEVPPEYIGNPIEKLENENGTTEDILNCDDDEDAALSTPSTTFDEDELRELDALELEPFHNYHPVQKPESPITQVREKEVLFQGVLSQIPPSQIQSNLSETETKPIEPSIGSENIDPFLDDDVDILPASPPKPKKKFVFKRNTQTLGFSRTNQSIPVLVNQNQDVVQLAEIRSSILQNEICPRVEEAPEPETNVRSIFSWKFGTKSNVAVEGKKNNSLVSSEYNRPEVIQTKTAIPVNHFSNASSSDEDCLPPTPPLKKKFVFKKKHTNNPILKPEVSKPVQPIVKSGSPIYEYPADSSNNSDLRRTLFPSSTFGSTNASSNNWFSKKATFKNQNTLHSSPRVSEPSTEFSHPTIIPTKNRNSRKLTSTKSNSPDFLLSKFSGRVNHNPNNWVSTAVSSWDSQNSTNHSSLPSASALPPNGMTTFGNRGTRIVSNEHSSNHSPYFPTLSTSISHKQPTTSSPNNWLFRTINPLTNTNKKFQSPSTPNSTASDCSPFRSPTPALRSHPDPIRQRKRRRKRSHTNPFVESQAEATDSDSNQEGSDTDLDEYETSFVDEGGDTISESQQVRYLKSVTNVSPMVENINRIVSRLEANHNDPSRYHHDSSETPNEEDDSFCVANDDIEFEEVGLYTQAMFNAAEEVALESPGANRFRRKLRSKTKLETRQAQAQQPKKPLSKPSSKDKGKQRKRIRMLSSDSD